MDSLILFVTAMVVSMTIVPLMIRIAPKIGMVDLPDPRKVHTMPIPRVGGVGIVIGAILPILFWLPFDPLLISYIFGCLVLLVFGVWDDSCELGHYVKFVGQFLSVIPVIFYADLYVSVLPLIGEIPELAGKIFTIIALVGMINAINHSDGLDGLAGGMSMLSLACIAYFLYSADDKAMLFLALSVMGGVFGFLRFNSHPAKVFMGDGGSQFLGFTLGFLAVVLTQKSNPALSPALPVLFLGLPIVDILAVFYLRISGGMNWFKATRNHIHHRLLDLGFTHYESVILIYLVQMLLIICSMLFMYEYDAVILLIYLSITFLIFTSLTVLERKGFTIKRDGKVSFIDDFITTQIKSRLVLRVLGNYIVISLPLIFISVVLMVNVVPEDIGYLSFLMILSGLIIYIFSKNYFRYFNKLVLYVVAALVVYLDYSFVKNGSDMIANIEIIVYSLVALSIIFLIRFDERIDFQMSPMDYLVVIIIILTFAVFSINPEEIDYGPSILKLVLLFYGCEIIERRNLIGFKIMSSASFLVLIMISFRVLM